MGPYNNEAFREYTEQPDDTVEIELDLSDTIPQAAKALYAATEDSDTPYESLSEEDREGYEAAVSLVLEAALPTVSEQIIQAVMRDLDD